MLLLRVSKFHRLAWVTSATKTVQLKNLTLPIIYTLFTLIILPHLPSSPLARLSILKKPHNIQRASTQLLQIMSHICLRPGSSLALSNGHNQTPYFRDKKTTFKRERRNFLRAKKTRLKMLGYLKTMPLSVFHYVSPFSNFQKLKKNMLHRLNI